VPELLDRARQRSASEGFEIEYVEGDAEALPFGDAEFDAVTTMFGSMFAPNHGQAAAELVRVVKPGGTIAISAWTPDGFIGELFKTTAKHVPPPAGVQSPLLWGTEAHLRGLFGDSISSLGSQERVFTYRLTAAEEFGDLFRRWYGPTLKAFEALETDEARAALKADIDELARRWNRLDSDDAVAIPAAYLETIIVTR
jgi:SAM-dependent methyltransferase